MECNNIAKTGGLVCRRVSREKEYWEKLDRFVDKYNELIVGMSVLKIRLLNETIKAYYEYTSM